MVKDGGPARVMYLAFPLPLVCAASRLQMIEPIDELGGQDKKAKSFILCIGDFPLQKVLITNKATLAATMTP